MIKEKSSVTITKKIIGKVTYIIESSASPEAKDSVTQKIKKIIKRDMEKDA